MTRHKSTNDLVTLVLQLWAEQDPPLVANRIARLLRVTRTTAGKWLKGETAPTADLLVCLDGVRPGLLDALAAAAHLPHDQAEDVAVDVLARHRTPERIEVERLALSGGRK